MAERKPCGKQVVRGTGRQVEDKGLGLCGYPRMAGKQQCVWHWLLKQPASTCKRFAEQRSQRPHFAEHRARVPKEEWPTGERWCAGCQNFVPLFYCSGSRCKSCASSANHEAMVQKTYGLEPGEYDALFEMQDGRCYICRRRSPSRRLAVDHDHVTGEPRGLLCPDPDRGCNHKVVGPLEANSVDGGLEAARRLVAYLESPPYADLRRRLANGATLDSVKHTARAVRAHRAAQERLGGTSGRPAPF